MRTNLPGFILAVLSGAALLPGITRGENAGIDAGGVIIGESGIAYRAQSGDTLMTIATRFTGAASNWVALGRLNGVSQNTRIAVGTVIHIPADLLLDQPVDARVIALSGTVIAINADKTVNRLQEGARVSEGMQIQTSGNSFITFEVVDGSRVSIPSNTLVRLTTLRATRYTRSPRTAITIMRGSVDSVVSPLKQNKGSFQILSPAATAAVRGTHFHVEILPDGSTAHALFDGVIALERRASTQRSMLQAGYGSVTSKQVIGTPVPLLAAPQLSAPPTLHDNAQLSLSVIPLAGAAAYHVQLATDSEALHPLLESRAGTPLITFGKVVDGDYSIRMAAVDANGIEGFSRVIPVSVRQQPSPAADNAEAPSAPRLANVDPQHFTLKWRNPAAAEFRVQVAHDSAFTWLQYNTTSQSTELRLPRPPFGTYYARIQRQNRDGSVGPFSAVQAFVVTDQWIIPEGLPRPAATPPNR